MDRIDCLLAFVRAMEGGSFSAAAKELGLGQPAVSKRIALLEEEFGSQLFMRTTRKLTPTREAHRVYDLARQVLGTFEAARASIREAPARPSGTLRVSVPSSFGRHYLMPIVRDYAREYPDVKLDLRFDERTINLVEEGIELALRIGQLESSSLMARRIGTVRRHLVATPVYLREHGTPRTPDDLKDHQCISYARLAPANQWTFESDDGRHVVSISGPVMVDDADAMREAVLQHLGVAIVPAWCVTDSIRRGEMKALLPDYTVSTMPLHAVYPETHWMSARARSFLDFVIARAEDFNA
ncbi:LysR family transcriptional regulator [Pseudorhodoplanes sp.]|uniref:LysR family transcriptional regulator n=1 Tax=Pseudorhodoplanes sp. TaxID=1934341 RepID=UPI002BEE52D6|nr:LysR family transcriptional regulator [Pseudorhodoplanes sp.]HWV53752.1 LysR family transcriptional regulator [Pseudorhodoplanes sp.]